MRVAQWMTQDVATTTPDVPAAEAGHAMHAAGVRHLPVMTGSRVVGMVSDRDVRGALPGRAVREVMSAPAYVVKPEQTIEAAARLMLSRHISCVPVVEEDDHLLGMLTTTDCLLAFLSSTPAVV
jgi:acetoin utilization protein AcuB